MQKPGQRPIKGAQKFPAKTAPAAKKPEPQETEVVPSPAVPPPPKSRRLVPTLSPLPTSPIEVVNNVICRDIVEEPANDDLDKEIPPDPTIGLLESVVTGVIDGSSLEAVKDEVTRLLGCPREKSDVIGALLRTHDYYRVAQWVRVRHDNERRIFKASQRGDLTTAESLAFLRLACAEISTITASTKAETHPDSGSMVDKLDNAQAERDKLAAEKYKGTTPHGREIVRKKLEAEKKKLLAERSTR
jgi:hypothetical protein